jgi:hypothetical protein
MDIVAVKRKQMFIQLYRTSLVTSISGFTSSLTRSTLTPLRKHNNFNCIISDDNSLTQHSQHAAAPDSDRDTNKISVISKAQKQTVGKR